MKLSPHTELRKRNWSRVVQDQVKDGTRGIERELG
jgi:hypothetical protein